MLKKLPEGERFIPSADEWELTFEDNFEFFDRTKWKFDLTQRRCCYNVDDSDVVFTKNGKLYIRTLYKKGKFGEGWYSAMLETSQNVHTDNAASGYKGFSQTGGYFEVRCKVAEAVGIWSAFWLMPDNNVTFSKNDIQFSGEDGVEIDVMESPHSFHLLNRQRNQNIHVIHADGYDDRLKSSKSPAYHIPKMYDEFHTYSLLWDDDKYIFFVDGQKTWETTHVYDGHQMGICKVPEYLLLSTEVAGSIENGVRYPGLVRNKKNGKLERFWCGNPDKNDKTKHYDFVVDYVRCYKRKEVK